MIHETLASNAQLVSPISGRMVFSSKFLAEGRLFAGERVAHGI
jgi:hypothetical protein